MNIVLRPRAVKSLDRIGEYISGKGYPENAAKFLERMRIFSHSLGQFPEKYPICCHKSYKKRKYRCAVFEENYIFIHKIIGSELVILNIVQAARIR